MSAPNAQAMTAQATNRIPAAASMRRNARPRIPARQKATTTPMNIGRGMRAIPRAENWPSRSKPVRWASRISSFFSSRELIGFETASTGASAQVALTAWSCAARIGSSSGGMVAGSSKPLIW